MSVKQKILTQATKRFNEEGYAAVSLNELANQLGMSRGNLTYHFKDKEELLGAIAKEMWDKMERERSKSRNMPSFANLHNEVQLYYKYQKEYAFIFLDPHVLQHPLVQTQFRAMTKQTMEDNKAALAFAINSGNLIKEPVAGVYNNIAFITWMLSFFWLAQQIIRGEKTEADGEKMIWSILHPYFTEKGVKSFNKFFGEGYLNGLGEPFKADLDSLIAF